MALGFTSHYNTNSEQPFGTLVLANNESETSGSIACTNNAIMNGLLYNSSYDSWEFSVSVNIDYSQYASYVAAASSGSTETAGSVAFSGDSFASAATVYSGGGASFSGGGVSFSSGGGCSTTFTC